MANLLATCPRCHTLYRVQHEQLRQAAGKVRCGQCQTVFNALEKAVPQTMAPPDAAVPPAPPGQSPGQNMDAGRTVTGEGEHLFDFLKEDFDDLSALGILAEPRTPRTGLLSRLRPKPPAIPSGPWTLPALLLALLLPLQALWWSGLFCGPLDCALPRHPDSIEILERHIVSHPYLSGALSLKLRIINRAWLPQVYPDLYLGMFDQEERLVAERLFSPQDYLGQQPESGAVMPLRKPLEISLTLADPGPSAVGFSFRFY